MVTESVVFIMNEHGFFAVTYLDDLVGADLPGRAADAFQALGTILKELGLQEAPDKATAPATKMVFLGLQVDMAEMSTWFPHGLEKWENFFQSGNFAQTGKSQGNLDKILEKSGKFRQFLFFV